MKFLITHDMRVLLVGPDHEVIGWMTLQDYTDAFGFRQASTLVRESQ